MSDEANQTGQKDSPEELLVEAFEFLLELRGEWSHRTQCKASSNTKAGRMRIKYDDLCRLIDRVRELI